MPLLSGVVLLAQLQLALPRLQAPLIDGQAGAEWSTAVTAEMASATVRLLHDGARVFALVEGRAAGIAHLCISRGDTVKVLHASASLGAASYVRRGDTYTLAAPFVWSVRDQDGVAASSGDREAYFAREGWTGSTMQQSPLRHEFSVAATWFTPETRVVVGFGMGGSMDVWPSGATDGCQNVPLAMGNAPASLRFTTESWAKLVLSP